MAGDIGSAPDPADGDGDELVMTFEPPPRPREPEAPQTAPEPEETPAKEEIDEFGLPVRRRPRAWTYDEERDGETLPTPVVERPSKQEVKTIMEEVESVTAATAPPAAVEPKEEKKKEEEAAASKKEDAKDEKKKTKDAVDKRASLASLPEPDRKQNEVKMFSEDPKDPSMPVGAISEWSHQQQVPLEVSEKDAKKDDESEDEWQAMPAYASYDMYDDNGRLIAKAKEDSDDEAGPNLGGASKGYTRVYDDEDAESATSMDEHTQYLFKEDENDDASRNPLSQMQATKELLTEGQRVAYVSVCRLAMLDMQKDLEIYEAKSRTVKKGLGLAVESLKMWSQKMMVRLYTHMEISAPEQVMIEQLAVHGVVPSDLTPSLMKNSRVANPMAASAQSSTPSTPRESLYSPRGPSMDRRKSSSSFFKDEKIPASPTAPPPPYDETVNDALPDVRVPSDLPESKTIDIDIRWTVLCDLFLVLIADSVYDARSRVLLERVGAMMDVPWLEICRFEKRVTDALEMQESTEQNWSEKEHLENRQRQARNKRYMMLGLATVGGSLVIGLSGGLLAPVIGAGLAAGFTTIGVAGTGSFLAGVGGTAMIATGATVSGGYIGGKAGWNRTKAVQTFEFRPLHNAKRVNLIITVSGWMNGKVDDVRLPYSTIDPVMGDLFAVHWEPEMLQSMGQTINLLATEVLTQSLQQVLGSTILIGLMSAIQLPVLLTKLSYLLDNPWSVSLDRASAAGLILADSLMHRNLGVRPVTLVGYSLGARVIFSCLRELARHGAYGLVQNVYLFGSPVVVKADDYAAAKSVVPGRFVNGYATNDWILGYLFRATAGGLSRVAGLGPADIPGVENVDCTALVKGHMDYRQAVPRLLRNVGWEVTSDEFAEIEEPDPDNHQERQRELINELDEARQKLEREKADGGGKKKGRFSTLFGRNKTAKKAVWETYEPGQAAAGGERRGSAPPGYGSHSDFDLTRSGRSSSGTYDYDPDAKEELKDGGEAKEAVEKKAADPAASDSTGVLFDVDAIRAELLSEMQAQGASTAELAAPPTKPAAVPATALPSLQVPSSPPASPRPSTQLKASRSWTDLINGKSRSKSRTASVASNLSVTETASPPPPPPPPKPRKVSAYDALPEYHQDDELQLQFEPPAGLPVRTSSRNGGFGHDPWADDNHSLYDGGGWARERSRSRSPMAGARPALKSTYSEPVRGAGSGKYGALGLAAGAGAGAGAGVGMGMGIGAAAVEAEGGKNVWLDEDDEFAPKEEGEMTMTFA